VSPGAPDPMNAARDDLAGPAEARCPGWEISHHLGGWTATRTSDQRTETATSLPGLLALVSVAGTAPAAPPGAAP
jgi:hypothetical protein